MWAILDVNDAVEAGIADDPSFSTHAAGVGMGVDVSIVCDDAIT